MLNLGKERIPPAGGGEREGGNVMIKDSRQGTSWARGAAVSKCCLALPREGTRRSSARDAQESPVRTSELRSLFLWTLCTVNTPEHELYR